MTAREDWLGEIQRYLEERIDDAPDKTCRDLASDMWEMTAGPLVDEIEEPACTCRPRVARSTDIDPPEGRVLDKWCPVHGRDPDDERDKRLDRERDR